MSSSRNSEPTGVRVNTRSGPADVPFTGPEWWVAAIYLVAALIAQIEVAHYFTFRGAQISFVLVVVVWYALRSDLLGAAAFGLAAGLCEDVFSAQSGAAWTISTTMVALFANYLTRWFFADSVPVVAGMVIVATLLRRMIFWIVMAIGGYPPGFARLHLHEALWESLMNAMLAVIALLLFRRFEEDRPAR